jgi:Outer membrane protein beta-barrel domain
MRRALFFLFFLLPAAAFAQPGRIEITPTVGYRLDGDFDARSSDAFDPNLNVQVDGSAVYGLLVDIPLAPNWALEILANRQQSQFVVDRGLLTPSSTLGDVDLTILQAGFVFQWGAGQVNPFITAAAGLTRIDPKFDELSTDDRLSASLGGGVKIFFSENIGLRLEARLLDRPRDRLRQPQPPLRLPRRPLSGRGERRADHRVLARISPHATRGQTRLRPAFLAS